MTFLDSLLDAIVRLDGDALVMHVGEKPYVTTGVGGGNFRGPLSWGQVELSSRPMTVDALLSMLGQILPAELQRSLADIGAIEHEIAGPGGGEKFILTAARGGDDVWVEVRRRPVIPEPVRLPDPEPVPVPEPVAIAAPEPPSEPEVIAPEIVVPQPEEEQPILRDAPAMVAQAAPIEEPVEAEQPAEIEEAIEVEAPVEFEAPLPAPVPIAVVDDEEDAQVSVQEEHFTIDTSLGDEFPSFEIIEDGHAPVVAAAPPPPADDWNELSLPEPVAAAPPPAAEAPPAAAPAAVAQSAGMPAEPAVVLPISRPALKLQPPPPQAPASEPSPAPPVVIDMLRTAAARGAATAYAVAGSRPFMRVEGDVVELAMEPVISTADIERFTFEYAARNDRAEAASEWVFSLPDVGRVRVVAFDDESGPGLVLHIASNVSTAEQIGLSHEAQKLCTEADGLVLVTGPRRNGKSTLLGAFVDLINRRRTDYVVTIESRICALHERHHALISQREVEGDGEAIARAARAALREGPDVLVLDDIRAPEAVAVALDAARSGRLVIAAIAAPSAAGAIDRLIDGFPTDRRPQVRALLASSLRGVVSQTLVEKKGGGRIAAREVLLGTPAVAKLVLDGASAQLGVAMESAARAGMRTLPQALAGLVRDGLVEAEEAYRHVPDHRAFLMMLQRESIDVSDSERRA